MSERGKEIKRIRQQCSLTQREFAAKMGMSLDTIKSWETDRCEVSVWHFYRAYDVLGFKKSLWPKMAANQIRASKADAAKKVEDIFAEANRIGAAEAVRIDFLEWLGNTRRKYKLNLAYPSKGI